MRRTNLHRVTHRRGRGYRRCRAIAAAQPRAANDGEGVDCQAQFAATEQVEGARPRRIGRRPRAEPPHSCSAQGEGVGDGSKSASGDEWRRVSGDRVERGEE